MNPPESQLHPAITLPVMRQYPWLKYLAQAFLLADKLSKKRIAEEKKKGRVIACQPGCSGCCRTFQVPVTMLELQGISWYTSEILEGDARRQIKQQLIDYPGIQQCPFLVDGLCGIRPMRPLSCRQFYVIGNPCSPDEDVAFSRSEDILRMGNRETCMEIATLIFMGMGAGNRRVCEELAWGEKLIEATKDMLASDFSNLIAVIDHFESTKS